MEGLEKLVKIDLPAALPLTEAARKLVKISKPRIRPKNAKNIHGYLTEEALTIEDNLLPMNIADADKRRLEIYLPHPFSHLVMKLFALCATDSKTKQMISARITLSTFTASLR